MYHDQGLPVLKYSGFERAVNLTLGLPYPRVAVDHGTALDIAGTGTADPSNLLAAIDTCTRLARQRPRSEEHTSELQSLMRISYAVFCLKQKHTHNTQQQQTQ